jgi:hypothetical protein
MCVDCIADLFMQKQRIEDLEDVLRALILHLMVRPENRVKAVEVGLRQYANDVLKEGHMGHAGQKSFEEMAKEDGAEVVKTETPADPEITKNPCAEVELNTTPPAEKKEA